MDLRRLIVITRAWLPVFLVVGLLAGAAAFVASNLQQKTYESKATLIVGQSLSATNPDYNQLLVSQRLSTTYSTVATTRPILDAVISQLGLTDTADKLAERVKADAPLDSTLLTITAQAPTPDGAAALANAIAAKLIAASPAIQGRQETFQQSIDSELAATQDEIASAQARVQVLLAQADRTAKDDADLQALGDRLASLRATYATLLSYSSGNDANLLTVVEPAVADPQPVAPRPIINALLAMVLGLLVVAGVAFLVETLDDSIKDPEAVRELVGLSTLGSVVRMRSDRGSREIYRLATMLYPRSSAAEAYRTLRTNVGFASVDAPIRTLLVTSAVPGEGKTVTAANLAVAFAQADHKVLLVDADLRKPGIHQIFDLPNQEGLTSLLRDGSTLAELTQSTEQPNLRVLTTGPVPPNPAELLGSHRMRQVLSMLAESADIVILDSPPIQLVTDAALLSSYVDGTLIVIDASHGRRRAVRDSRDALTRAGANILGAVLNRIPQRSQAGHGDYYYHDKDATPGDAQKRPGPEAPLTGSVP